MRQRLRMQPTNRRNSKASQMRRAREAAAKLKKLRQLCLQAMQKLN